MAALPSLRRHRLFTPKTKSGALMAKHLFTSESVSEGHPDKIADQISDAVLDAILEQDPKARVACETYVKTGMVMVGGEVTTSAWVRYTKKSLVKQYVKLVNVHSDMGFDADSCAVLNTIGKQVYQTVQPRC
eukprot:TRINITY_DN4699_c0_g2_i3.p1 TRINITY_DN4699_c0_g2~~TRINITY_DN4699_c0_g2_i3.p1  ORF type:complete len:132 (-),score=7.53 TRINITY_DN4699_c0_g2_i3:208-603(-)